MKVSINIFDGNKEKFYDLDTSNDIAIFIQDLINAKNSGYHFKVIQHRELYNSLNIIKDEG